MYRSVGKLLRSLRMIFRDGASAFTMVSAALSTLKRLTLVESAHTTSPGPAPTSRAILSPMRPGSSIQCALFQLRMRPVPHSSFTTCCTRAGYVCDAILITDAGDAQAVVSFRGRAMSS